MDIQPTTNDLIRGLRQHFSQQDLADQLNVSVRTLARWEKGITYCPEIARGTLEALGKIGRLLQEPVAVYLVDQDFSFIDLFAGIGGIRLGFEQAGGHCVFTSEWDKFSEKTYVANFGNEHPVEGDITKIPPHRIPDHDVLLAGFPCQPFSLAGVSKKNSLGRPHGFQDPTQGTLFHNIVEILSEKRPKAFLLENVKNLRSHDKGRTFAIIEQSLRDLGYHFTSRVINGNHWVPQNRERILIAGFREDVGFDLNQLQLPERTVTLDDILEDDSLVDEKYILTDNLWDYLQRYAEKHRLAGNGFGFGLVNRDTEYSRTLSARYHKDGSEILVDRGPGNNPRRLTPRECARLMGYPDDFVIPVSDTQAYRQFGNSVVVPMMSYIAKAMAPFIVSVGATKHHQQSFELLNV